MHGGTAAPACLLLWLWLLLLLLLWLWLLQLFLPLLLLVPRARSLGTLRLLSLLLLRPRIRCCGRVLLCLWLVRRLGVVLRLYGGGVGRAVCGAGPGCGWRGGLWGVWFSFGFQVRTRKK